MYKLLFTALFMLLGLSAFAQVNPDNIVETVSTSMNLFKTGAWLAGSVGVLQVIIYIMKKGAESSIWVKKYGKVIVLVLSAAMSVMTSIVGGVNIVEALVVFALTAGTSFIHDLMTEVGILTHKEEPAVVAPNG